MKLNNAKEMFYDELYRMIENNEIKSEGFITFVNNNKGASQADSTSGFYELCSKFADISLNYNMRIKNGDTTNINHYDEKDIAEAKTSFKQFVSENNLKDTAEILDALERLYVLAVNQDDPRNIQLNTMSDYKDDATSGATFKVFFPGLLDYNEMQIIKSDILKEMSN